MQYDNWSCIQQCHLVIVTVNSVDTEACAEMLIQTMEEKMKVPIFSLQRGVKNSATLKDL